LQKKEAGKWLLELQPLKAVSLQPAFNSTQRLAGSIGWTANKAATAGTAQKLTSRIGSLA
jgi:hypothetical protein